MSTIAWADAARQRAFDAWISPLAAAHGLQLASLRAASADASFRRYLRVDAQGGASLIVMDAPPPQEDVRPFVHVAQLIAQAGLVGPQVLAHDDAQGFVLLSDLGQRLYLPELQQCQARGNSACANSLMLGAINALIQWQQRVPAAELPPYDAALLGRELDLFPEWCVQREFGVTWGEAEQVKWQGLREALINRALAQPVVAVHRDFMPRNLMVTSPGAQPAILDFQDAVAGPISYDVVSLLRDAFISWEEEQEIDWAVRYWQAARAAKLPVPDDFAEFWCALEWMGLQRHLKILGIFCRLKHRDGKPAYSADLPRFFTYAHKVAMRYRELAPLIQLMAPMTGNAREAGYTF